MKKNLMIIVGLIGILIPVNIKALTGSVVLSCKSNTLTVNTSTTCTLSGNSNEGVSALSAKLSASGNISVSNIVTSTVWLGDGSDGNIELYGDSDKKGSFAIATFTITAKSSVGTGKINVDNITFYDSYFNGHNISTKSLSITVKEAGKQNASTNTQNNNTTNKVPSTQNNQTVQKSNDATLKALVLSDGEIDFSADVLDYEVEVLNEVDRISIVAEANDSNASVLIPEELNLKLGINVFEIKVIAEDGTEKVYNLYINRLAEGVSKKSDSNISLIVVSILFLISLGLNIFFIVKIKKNKILVDKVKKYKEIINNLKNIINEKETF